ncbi:AlbA family DNA-binding domain-containing protein [Nocardia flavorosea]|uniref:AlbA family DNA-binding domain-containing protein n=1 Tax=Nocardia flavorosea TaxID=53429 RepID=UPI002455DECF|nr:RNA-binding domain-containing protein [Nocardia flavorosea]
MPLAIDATRALRTPGQLGQLIRAVHAADMADESRAVEWKSGFDPITSNEASFMIAKTVLGFANRPVVAAKKDFEGVGYLLVGVEPGSLRGQAVPDSAQLLNAVRRYTGSGMPIWDPRTVEVDGRIILVITVEAPRPGDRIALLRKGFQPGKGALIPEGTVFVRQPGATERATREDLEMLQDRLLDGAAENSAAVRALEQRREILLWTAELIDAGETWANSMEMLVISSTGHRWSSKDWVEWFETDSGREQVASMKLLQRNARKIRMLSKDTALLAAIAAVEQVLSDSQGFDAWHASSGESSDGRAQAYRHLNRVRARLRAVQAAAVPLEVETVEEVA